MGHDKKISFLSFGEPMAPKGESRTLRSHLLANFSQVSWPLLVMAPSSQDVVEAHENQGLFPAGILLSLDDCR